MKFAGVIEYDGAKFHGFQKQAQDRTVAGELEKALAKVTGATVKIAGAGRTDSGVHARGQVISFSVETRLTPEALGQAVNAVLAKDILVRSLSAVPDEFDARRSAVRKEYCYRILTGRYVPVRLRQQVYHYREKLDLSLMRAGAMYLLGRRDFRSFAASGGKQQKKSTIREIYRLDITEEVPEGYPDLKMIKIRVEANGFLYKMVRSIAGTLIEVGRGRIDPDRIKAILEGRDRKLAGFSAPAKGLILEKVDY